MLAYFEAKVKYLKLLDNGKVKNVVEPYLVKAASFTEAEARTIEEVTPYISGDFTVEAVAKSNVAEVFRDDSGDWWYKVKANFIQLDEKNDTEKLSASYFMVQAKDFRNAYDNFLKEMSDTVSDYTIASIAETKIMDVIE